MDRREMNWHGENMDIIISETANKREKRYTYAIATAVKAILATLEKNKMFEKEMKKRNAYKEVYNDLKKIGPFMGKYDSKHGKKDFMYGIWTVMEYIAYEAGEEEYKELNDTFTKNLIESGRK